ncbi:MAG: cytochrome C oxidase subunit IV family protein [Longimicrobiales bacterium]
METTHAAEAVHKAPNYMAIWGILLVLTIAEVGVAFFSGMSKVVLIILLLILAIWKAVLVALYYMHLIREPKKLWLIAVSPVPLIIILLSAVLLEGF